MVRGTIGITNTLPHAAPMNWQLTALVTFFPAAAGQSFSSDKGQKSNNGAIIDCPVFDYKGEKDYYEEKILCGRRPFDNI